MTTASSCSMSVGVPLGHRERAFVEKTLVRVDKIAQRRHGAFVTTY